MADTPDQTYEEPGHLPVFVDPADGSLHAGGETLDTPDLSGVATSFGEAVDASNLPTTDPDVAGDLWSNGGIVAVSGSDLPTSDPAVIGALWNDSGVVSVSAGPPGP